MKIIFLRDVRGVGEKGEVQDVKNGYARNFLIPGKFAEAATPQGLEKNRREKASIEAEQEQHRARLESAAHEIRKFTLMFRLKVGEKGEAFGSVSAHDIEAELEKRGVTVAVKSKHHIKTLGEHDIELDLGSGVKAKLRVLVEPETSQ